MRKLIFITLAVIISLDGFSQDNNADGKKPLTPYVTIIAGGCVDNPFQFVAGVQKTIRPHLSLAYDVHFWSTGYSCYCDDMYSVGKYTSVTPSVKLTYNTGKREGMGLSAGVGLGYVFARDRGTEQSYTYDKATNIYQIGKDVTPGNWDFNSIAPSVTLGVGFRVLKVPVTFQSEYYFAKTTEGWMATAGGVGLKIGLKRYK